MLDSPRLTIAARRAAPVVEDARPSEAVEDPIQRRDLILLERARDGSLDAFNDLVECYQDHLFALVARMVPDRDQAGDAVQEAFFSAYRNMRSFRGGSVRSWLSRIAINAAMDQQRLKKRRPSQPYPELEDESWQPPAGDEADPVRTAMQGERTRVLNAALAVDHARPAAGHRPVRRRGLRLRRDRGDDRGVAGDGEVADPPWPTGPARSSRGQHRTVPRRGRLMPHLPASHADHDPLAIAAYAAGDATGSELDDAQALVAACGDCAALHHDLRAIAAALPALPAPARTRDFRLTPEQAASLRPAGWRRLLAPFAGPKFAFAGPVGAGLATLGLAGFLVAGSFGVPLAATAPTDGGAAAASGAATVERANDSGGAELFAAESPASVALPAAEAPEDVVVPGGQVPAGAVEASEAPADDAQGEVAITQAGPGATVAGDVDKMATGVAPTAEPVPVVPMLSAVALLLGITLAGLRFAGRRVVARA